MATVTTVASTGRPEASRHWGLFADWCTATDRCPLPATPDTVLAFLAELPTGPATTARRVAAIDAAHHSSGLTPPGASPPLTNLLHPPRLPRFDPDLVAAALRNIPVGGWPTGIVGRRDAALVALIASAGMTRRQVRALRCDPGPHGHRGDPMTGETAIPEMATSQDPGSCPACALTRWQRVAAAVATAGWRSVRGDLADLGEIPAGTETTHDCARPVTWSFSPGGLGPGGHGTGRRVPDNREMSLFCAIDRHGAPESAWPLSIRSITTIVATRLSAASRADHDPPRSLDPERAAAGPGASWSNEDHARALAQRKTATDRLASLEAALDEADAHAEAVLQRLDAEDAPSTGTTAEDRLIANDGRWRGRDEEPA